jgi:hypothetical protein
MIPYIENINPVINSDGSTSFQIEGETGVYQLIVDKQFKMFELISPDGWTESNLVNIFAQHIKRYNALEQGLAGWIYMCIGSVQQAKWEEDYGFAAKTITMDGRSYVVEYCEHTKEIIVTIPGFLYVGKSSELISEDCQIAYLESGLVIQKIGDVVYQDLMLAGKTTFSTEQIALPTTWNNIHEYEVGEGTYQIGYDANSDMVMVLTKAKTVKTEFKYLDKKLPELQHLHSGDLKQAVISFISELESRSSF